MASVCVEQRSAAVASGSTVPVRVHRRQTFSNGITSKQESSESILLNSPCNFHSFNSSTNNDRTGQGISWTGALERRTEIPSALLLLQGAPRRELRLSHQSSNPPVHRRNSIVVPSIHSRNNDDNFSQGKGTLTRSYSKRVSRPSLFSMTSIGNSDITFKSTTPLLKSWDGKDLGVFLGGGSVRIAVMGAAKTGKSALVSRFIDGTFVEQYQPTTEKISRRTIQVDEHKCTLDVIDTSATIRDRDMHYFEICHGFILVFSLANPASWRKVKAFSNAIEHARGRGRSPVVVVATHSDVSTCSCAEVQLYQHEVESWENFVFIETSAVSPRCGNVFYTLARLIRTHYFQLLADDYQSFHVETPGHVQKLQPSSVKSAPAALTRKRMSLDVAEPLQRSTSTSQLRNGNGQRRKSILRSRDQRGNLFFQKKATDAGNESLEGSALSQQLAEACRLSSPTSMVDASQTDNAAGQNYDLHAHCWIQTSSSKHLKCFKCNKGFTSFLGRRGCYKCADTSCQEVRHRKCRTS